jgi:hypothetical protein
MPPELDYLYFILSHLLTHATCRDCSFFGSQFVLGGGLLGGLPRVKNYIFHESFLPSYGLWRCRGEGAKGRGFSMRREFPFATIHELRPSSLVPKKGSLSILLYEVLDAPA